MSVLARCPYERGVRISGVSVIARCPQGESCDCTGTAEERNFSILLCSRGANVTERNSVGIS